MSEQERDECSMWELLKVSTHDERHKMMADVLALTLSWQIRAIRQSRGWTQNELATRAGLSLATINRVEDPSYILQCSVSTLLAISKAFDCGLIVQFSGWKEWLEAMFTRQAFIPAPFDGDKLAAFAGQSA